MKYTIVLAAVLLTAIPSFASDLRIENVRYFSKMDTKGDVHVVFDLKWKNGWRNSRNHDAAWVFFKFPRGNDHVHARVAADGHKIIPMPGQTSSQAIIDVAEERTGLFIYPAAAYRGDIDWRVSVRLETEGLDDRYRSTVPKAFGIEMVYIKSGGFTLGDADQKAHEYGAFYRSNANGEPDGHITISSENEIRVGAEEGSLYYRKGDYVGDRTGPVPAAFPKGFETFYVMKYELTQGQYADFLNNIPGYATYNHVNFMGRDYYDNKGTIRLVDGKYIAGKPDRPMNFISWDDGLAFADWAALRPLTELEFTKAARGPGKPMSNEYPWGTSDTNQLARIVDSNNDLTLVNGWSEDRLEDKTRAVFGASHFWVMDLAGSVWERVITIGSADGRAFKGTPGDGEINTKNDDWPYSSAGKEGHGFRGGGFYFQGRNEHEFNPYSPIAYRRFGGWSGADPHMAYGFRAAR